MGRRGADRGHGGSVLFMKKGDTFQMFGCTWLVDVVYEPREAEIRQFCLVYDKRFRAHVISACEGYSGVREVNAAIITGGKK